MELAKTESTRLFKLIISLPSGNGQKDVARSPRVYNSQHCEFPVAVMRFLLLLLTAVLISLAWLSPDHTYPWLTFASEMLSFAAFLSLLALFLNRPLQLPRVQLLALPIVCIPMIQWGFGLVVDFSSALLSSAYLLGFWFAVLLGYNLSRSPDDHERMFTLSSYLMFAVALVTSLIACIQWLNLESYVPGVMNLYSHRPYANFAQPNNMSTFLIMGLLACLYLAEKQPLKQRYIWPVAALIIFAITLSQSRTAWVFGLFFIIYWTYKSWRYPTRLKRYVVLLWAIGFFAVGLLFPRFTGLIQKLKDGDVVQTSSVVQRASAGHERLGIWHQMLDAINQKPWTGYGWNQTSIAELSSMSSNTIHVWFTSAHNLILDLLVWNGWLLGGVIVLCILIWIFWLNAHARTTESIIACLMVAAVLIHALLEYPLQYAYFLLPVGFLMGLIQAQTPDLTPRSVPVAVTRSVWVLGIVLVALIWRDYSLYKVNSLRILKKQPANSEIWGSSKILILTEFDQRLYWLKLSPVAQLTSTELDQIEKMVQNKATPYNLQKYAQLLLANHQFEKAQQQIAYLNRLHKKNYTLQDLQQANASAVQQSK